MPLRLDDEYVDDPDMLARLRIRSKLLVILAAPLFMLAVLIGAQLRQVLAGDADRGEMIYLGATAVAVLVAILFALFVARATAVPMRQLTTAAQKIATESLPGLLVGIRDASASDAVIELEPIPVATTDEVGELAIAFNQIQSVVVEVANEQAELLKKGMSELFVNLARRNQALIERQITFIDHLEGNEQDPEALSNLFELDHLAARMRRNAESLLVLAGVEPFRRWTEPIPVTDVVRAATGEIEAMSRVRIGDFGGLSIAGHAVSDTTHVLAELLDNATSFSSPATTVSVSGKWMGDRYMIFVSDQGLGMAAEQIEEANQLLVRPPLVGLVLSKSLGFTVVARLGSRHGLQVQLASNPKGGVIAGVLLPAELTSVVEEAPVPLPVIRPSTVEPPRTTREPDLLPRMPSPSPAPVPDPVPVPVLELPPPVPVPVAAVAALDAHERPEPVPVVTEELTSTGLVRRQRQVTTVEDEGVPREVIVRASTRSAEEISRMLSSYRSGLGKGRRDEETT